MTWISGRTISPSSGELVFWIDENANLPGPQNWEQMWQTCQGEEPIVVAQERELIRPTLLEDYGIASPTQACCVDTGGVARDHLMVELCHLATEKTAREDVEPMSNCSTSFRTLTFTLVNFDITDGGDSIETTRGCVGHNCDEIAIALRTRGKNPSRATLNPMFPSDILRAIAWQESRWNHFLPNGKPKSNTNTNGTVDWGLMQINQATVEQQWNWKLNLSQGISLLGTKKTAAENYLNRHPKGVTAEMIENEMIQRYNGGTYYKWDASGGGWVEHPANDYVASIRAIVASKPWQS
ncbi:transglycosylase SLT domain-containing protein [Mesorhizobium sp. WSM4884]|uniref:transglycosylase SLT domain-containing protein n=1 Tax=Mesorhizobium sp. WSM4884 TaxID=3038542 RepID=UPI00241786AA|nr:transglycosylase SLT domain-containing protein [Mesorhizobium sp. WSM4884]MDG4882000.1 transglycosylase SLT domain-containing protein [Mesorhizobium sp. WSM4884]